MDNRFPAMLYKYPGPHEIHGDKFDYTIAADEDEANEALAAGWHLNTDEAKAAMYVGTSLTYDRKDFLHPAIDDSAPTRDELKQQADKLGLEYPKNIPTDKLEALIAEAMAQPATATDQSEIGEQIGEHVADPAQE